MIPYRHLNTGASSAANCLRLLRFSDPGPRSQKTHHRSTLPSLPGIQQVTIRIPNELAGCGQAQLTIEGAEDNRQPESFLDSLSRLQRGDLQGCTQPGNEGRCRLTLLLTLRSQQSLRGRLRATSWRNYRTRDYRKSHSVKRSETQVFYRHTPDHHS